MGMEFSFDLVLVSGFVRREDSPADGFLFAGPRELAARRSTTALFAPRRLEGPLRKVGHSGASGAILRRTSPLLTVRGRRHPLAVGQTGGEHPEFSIQRVAVDGPGAISTGVPSGV
jgi:hypothetical protein